MFPEMFLSIITLILCRSVTISLRPCTQVWRINHADSVLYVSGPGVMGSVGDTVRHPLQHHHGLPPSDTSVRH